MRATIKDIASKINLSVTTVSLVLNNKPSKIPEETKQLVLNAARELNYRPNQLAIGLIKKRTKTIGLIVSDIRNSFFSSLAKGVEDECRKSGWTVILCNTSDKHERDIEYINVLASKSVDGILYCMSIDTSPEKFKQSRELLCSLNIPCVMIDRLYASAGLPLVGVDHVTGGFLATSHLLELGHRRIACVAGPLHLSNCQCRLEGYKKALADWKVPYDPTIVVEGSYDMASGVLAVDQLMDKDFSAIFAFNDMMAYGVYQGLKQHDLAVPQDVSVVGYDDIFPSEILDVPLTTIHQPVRRTGSAAAKKLISVIEGEPQAETELIFLPELVVRKSTALYNAH